NAEPAAVSGAISRLTVLALHGQPCSQMDQQLGRTGSCGSTRRQLRLPTYGMRLSAAPEAAKNRARCTAPSARPQIWFHRRLGSPLVPFDPFHLRPPPPESSLTDPHLTPGPHLTTGTEPRRIQHDLRRRPAPPAASPGHIEETPAVTDPDQRAEDTVKLTNPARRPC
ncbi:hypothetical protein GOODEAATRI_007066, partial [Goodea atripinnis]